MACLKCGRETIDNQVFCDRCLETMATQPVKPDAAVYLPHRKEIPPSKKGNRRRKQMTEQEQIAALRHRIQNLWTTILVMVLLIALLCGAGFYHLQQDQRPLPGQNYSTVAGSSTQG